MPKVNYTSDQAKELITLYDAGRGVSVDELAKKFDKSKRSIVAKLVNEKVYVAPVKPEAKAKDEGPTKKELLSDFTKLVGREVAGLEPATKAALSDLIEIFGKNQ
jgi:hypothetical protein